ncbi:MAG TPA: hypothetical protein VNX29_06530 [Kaistia sp.]|nr:hypothetical protein [Kaistia sp.]
MEGRVEGQSLVDQWACFIEAIPVEQDLRETGIRGGIARIGFDGAAQGLLGGERPAPIEFEQADSIPDLGIARRSHGRPAQGFDRGLDLTVDIAANAAFPDDDLRILGIQRLRLRDGLPHLLAPVEDLCDLRGPPGDARIVRKALSGVLQNLGGRRQVLLKGDDMGMSQGGDWIVVRELGLRIDALRIGKGLRDIAPVGREDAPLRIEAALGPCKQ